MKITLSFDNGPDPGGTTLEVLNVLDRRRLKSTFFVTGSQLRIPGAIDLVRSAKELGHWIGNHTFTHTVMLNEMHTESTLEAELGVTERLIGEYSDKAKFFRPYAAGAVGPIPVAEVALQFLMKNGYTCVMWNNVPRDWEEGEGWIDRCIHNAEQQDWSVVVLHDLPTGAMQYLEVLIDRFQERGMEIVQEFPDSVVPVKSGAITPSFSSLFSVV